MTESVSENAKFSPIKIWNSLTPAKIALLMGLIVFAAILARTFYDIAQTPQTDRSACESELARKVADEDGENAARDEAGKLRIISVLPTAATTNRDICVLVAGVASRATELAGQDDVGKAKTTLIQRNTELAEAEAKFKEKSESVAKIEALGTPDDAAHDNLKAEKEKADKLKTKLQTAETEHAKAYNAYKAAVSTAAEGLKSVPLNVFLNGYRAPHITVKAVTTSDAQVVVINLDAPSSKSEPASEFWRNLLHSPPLFGEKKLTIGLSRQDTSAPEYTAPGLTLKIYDSWMLAMGAVSLSALAISLVLFARNSTLLRDNALRDSKTVDNDDGVRAAQAVIETVVTERQNYPAKTEQQSQEDYDASVAPLDARIAAARLDLETARAKVQAPPVGSFSLARTQMAFWLLITLSAFLFIWIVTGNHQDVFVPSALALLGISATTALFAVPQNQDELANFESEGFWKDLTTDKDGRPQLYRIQAIAWTIVLGVIFAWNVIYNLQFTAFDTNLLVLMGLGSVTYLGFKFKDG